MKLKPIANNYCSRRRSMPFNDCLQLIKVFCSKVTLCSSVSMSLIFQQNKNYMQLYQQMLSLQLMLNKIMTQLLEVEAQGVFQKVTKHVHRLARWMSDIELDFRKICTNMLYNLLPFVQNIYIRSQTYTHTYTWSWEKQKNLIIVSIGRLMVGYSLLLSRPKPSFNSKATVIL